VKTLIATALLAASIGFGVSSASAAPSAAKLASPDTMIEKAQSERTCRRLRRQCMFKDERGERGEGNCRRYRRVCERWWR